MRKIVIASDSFKGSLTSAEVAVAVEKGLKSVLPDCQCIRVSIADGGEGTVDALRDSLGARMEQCRAHDPLMRSIMASYAILPDGQTAVIETAAASGLPLISPNERNPLKTSTFGTGELILDALRKGCTRILVGLGGSATNDGGMGALSALGFRFYDAEGGLLPGCGESLAKVARIEGSDVLKEVSLAPCEDAQTEVGEVLKGVSFTLACDVKTPFCGQNGAAFVFAPQKGASDEDVTTLDRGMAHFAGIVRERTGYNIADLPGAGAAGGMGGGLMALLSARMMSGVELVLEAVGFDSLLEGADAVITGEGRIDSQTGKGKAPFGVLAHARAKGIPVYAIGGSVASADVPALAASGEGYETLARTLGFQAIEACVSGDYDLAYVMRPEIAAAGVTAAAARLATKHLSHPHT